MKKNLFLVLALSVLAAGCNKENNEPSVGERTYASFSITIANPATTRPSSTDPNGVAEEQSVNNLHVYIFSGDVYEGSGSITVNNQNKGTTAIQTTTGPKTIYAVANRAGGVTTSTGMTRSEFEQQLLGALNTEIANSTSGFLMVGSTETTLLRQEQNEAIANPVPISVSRAAAKVQLKYANNTPVATKLDMTVSEVKYDLAQRNTQMYLVRDDFSPKGENANQTDADNDGTYDHLVKLEEDKLDLIDVMTGAFDNTYAKSRYLGENVNAEPSTGNTSFIVIKLKVTPNTGASTDGSFWVVAKTDKAAGTIDFATENDKVKYFSDETAASQHLTANTASLTGYEVVKYTNGYAWYRLNLRDASKTTTKDRYSVLRNNYYKANVTQVYGLGFNTPGGVIPTNPDTPLETGTYISAEITIVDWTVVEMNEPIG